MRKPFLLIPLLFFSFLIEAQNNSPSSQRLKIFIDCSNTWCDQTFIKTEINIVDFLLDNQAADLHLLITQQSTGGGGRQYQLLFLGQNRFKNLTDTLRFNTSPNATDFENREMLLKYIKLGLSPFIAKTSSVNGITINMKQENSGEKKETETTKDPWDYWVFRISANGSIDADEHYKGNRFNGKFTVNRTTEDLKVDFSINGSKNKTTFEDEDSTGTFKYVTQNNDYGFSHYLIKSINSHWSYGYEATVTSSTFSNNRRRVLLRTGIEYDIFPYRAVNNKFLTIGYIIDVRHNKYYEVTLYDKTKETLAGHSIEVNAKFNQKWGSAFIGIDYHNYFHNWKYYFLNLEMFLSVRISGGLSFDIGAFGGLTRDQLYLVKGKASEQEILTRRRQLASGYNYYTSLGLSYRFGSKLSNFVNPRFGGGND